MDDKTLPDNILAALDWDPSINATEIGVTVDKGIMTLTGHVQTYPERFTAGKIVKQVKVQNGFVTLTGEVEWNYQKTAAEDAMSRT